MEKVLIDITSFIDYDILHLLKSVRKIYSDAKIYAYLDSSKRKEFEKRIDVIISSATKHNIFFYVGAGARQMMLRVVSKTERESVVLVSIDRQLISECIKIAGRQFQILTENSNMKKVLKIDGVKKFRVRRIGLINCKLSIASSMLKATMEDVLLAKQSMIPTKYVRLLKSALPADIETLKRILQREKIEAQKIIPTILNFIYHQNDVYVKPLKDRIMITAGKVPS